MDERPASRRDRHRAELLDEVRVAALRQVAEGGPGAVSIAGIAREIGVSAPSLYHYFDSRDDLLAALVLESHEHLTAHQVAATHEAQGASPADRLRILAYASRDWCVDNPDRFRLVFADAPAARSLRAAEVVPVSRRGLAQVLAAVAALDPPPLTGPLDDPELAAQVAAAFADPELGLADVPPNVLLRGFLLHIRLLGLANLDVLGVFEGSGMDLRRMYAAEVEQIIAELSAAG